MALFSGDFDEKYGISLSRCHARVGDILCTHRSWRSTPSQLLKKVAQAKPKGLLHLFVLSSSKLSNRLFHLIQNRPLWHNRLPWQNNRCDIICPFHVTVVHKTGQYALKRGQLWHQMTVSCHSRPEVERARRYYQSDIVIRLSKKGLYSKKSE